MKGIKSITNKIMPHTKWVMPAVEKFAKTTFGKIVIAAVVIYFTWGLASGAFAGVEAAVPALTEGAGAATWGATASGSLGVGAGATLGGEVAAGAAGGAFAGGVADGVATGATDAFAGGVAEGTITGAAEGAELTGNGIVNSVVNTPTAAAAPEAAADFGVTGTATAGAGTGAPAAASASAAPTAAAGNGSTNIIGRAFDWYKGLSAPGQMAVGQAIAGAGSAAVNAISARQQQQGLEEAEARRRQNAAVPDVTYMFKPYRTPGIVNGVIRSGTRGG